MKNLNLIFNKVFYEKLGIDNKEFNEGLEEIIKSITSTRYDKEYDFTEFEDEKKSAKKQAANRQDVDKEPPKPKFFNRAIVLATTYPGLLIGTGNPHGVHDASNDIALGFSFDYVTGQPYIPGSSVKGVLRSHFKRYPGIVAEILESEGVPLDVEKVKDLECEIFEGTDVFFDAVLYKNNRGVILGEDYITPHKESTKNPTPIHMLKVLPGVEFQFRFMLHDGELLNAGQKRDLFKDLLTLFGAGAKTNVGYGFFEVVDNNNNKNNNNDNNNNRNNNNNNKNKNQRR